jgi:hypothetical protein
MISSIAFALRTTLGTSSCKYGVSFSPAGLLTPYHIGASKCLVDLGVITSECGLAGSSGGALAAVTSALLCHIEKNSMPLNPLEASVYVAQQCRDFGGRGTLRTALDTVLEKLLPEDVHNLLNDRHAPVQISFTTLGKSTTDQTNFITPHFITKFQNKQDVIDCLRASCNIPFYFNGNNVFVPVRGMKAIDGFFSVDFRRFGCPNTFATHRELIICPYKQSLVNIKPDISRPLDSQCEYDIISPSLLDEKYWPFSFKQVLQMSFTAPESRINPEQPISDEELCNIYQIIYEAGYESARRWYDQTGQHVWGK